ncbi:MAG TPA: tyrosine-type recombinase/integrase [Xanthobacteraceae bacterium]|nr:tyrosine-type recombinase/integrase [Xanthobacteraceae bacterium]
MFDITGARCRAYEKHRGKKGGARRDLEDLRAAINHHAEEGLHRAIVNVQLPEKGEPRDRWLTRDEAAKLLWVCWRAREQQRRKRAFGKRAHKLAKQLPTAKHTLRHLARFILIGLYTGSRATPIACASFHAAAGRSYIDLAQGMFYRRPEGARITKKRQPPVPIPDRLLAHMRRWKRKGIADQYAVEWHGEPVKSVKTAMKSAVAKAQLPGKISPHTLRHTAATWLMQAGTDMWQAAGYLGMSLEMLERVYGHHHPDYMSEATAKIGAKPKRPNGSPMKRVNQTATRRIEA